MSRNNFSSSQAFYMQYSGTPTQGHEDLLHSLTSPDQPQVHAVASRVLVNPNFRLRERTVAQTVATLNRHSVHITSQQEPLSAAATGRLNRHSVHINPRLQAALQLHDGSSAKIVINPKFHEQEMLPPTSSVSSGTVHINPNFKPSPPSSPKKANVHVNPRFATRPLPSIPGQLVPISASIHAKDQEPVYANVNGGLSLDAKKQSDFVQSIQQQTVVALRRPKPPAKPVRNSILLDRHHLVSVAAMTSDQLVVPHSSTHYQNQPASAVTHSSLAVTPQIPKKVEEKENNLPSTSKKSSFLFTPLRRTAFKKIGERKLIRVKKKSLSPGTPKPSFKRIGNRKLIRIRDSLTGNEGKAINSPLQVYDIKTKTKLVKTVKNTPTNASKYRFSFITPLSVRRLRLARGEAPTSERLRLSADVVKKTSNGGFANRFRLDRRQKTVAAVAVAAEECVKDKCSTLAKRSSQSRLKKLSGSTYHVSATKLQKVAPPKPGRGRNFSIYRPRATTLHPGIAPNKIITVQGVKYAVAENGRRLRRLSVGSVSSARSAAYNASVSQEHTSPGGLGQSSPPTIPSAASSGPRLGAVSSSTTSLPVRATINSHSPPSATASSSSSSRLASPVKAGRSAQLVAGGSETTTHKKVYLGGEEFDEIEPGVFTRSRHSLTRQSITQAKNRSINIILKNQNRSKQYCMFFNKFGKCTKKDKGSCPFIHDPEKIAVCKRFLQGACHKEVCLLSHRLAPEKMPACKYFLEGVCTRVQCPYLHVKVSADAGICADFLRGYCPNGADCPQRHVIACPEFDRTGHCTKETKCPFPHVVRATGPERSSSGRRPAPAKPKRKSLGQTSDQNLKKSRVANRYYQDGNLDVTPEFCGALEPNTPGTSGEQPVTEATDLLAEKRKRLLRKMEISMQAWSRPNQETEPTASRVDPDDSGPYERIAGDSSGEEDEEEQGENSTVIEVPQPRKYGQLGDFISLAGYSSGEEAKEDRLI